MTTQPRGKPKAGAPIVPFEIQIEQRPITQLIPYARNSRTHSDAQIGQIAASITEFGWTNPILIDGKNGIIAGHGRLAAAKRLQMTEVPVIVLDHLTETQKRALIIADNKLALNADWDQGLLESEIAALVDEEFDISILGFDDDEPFEPARAQINSIDTSTVADIFWISVSGPLPQQAEALERLKVLMGNLPDITVELGTVQRDG